MTGHQTKDRGAMPKESAVKARRPRTSKKSAFASLCSTLKLGRPRAGRRQPKILELPQSAGVTKPCSLRFILSTNGRDYTYLGSGPQLGVNRMTKEQWDDIALKPLNPFFQFRTCAKNKNRFAGMQRQECRIVELFAEEWNKMSPEEQLPYEQMAAAARFEFKLLEQSVIIVEDEDNDGVESCRNSEAHMFYDINETLACTSEPLYADFSPDPSSWENLPYDQGWTVERGSMIRQHFDTESQSTRQGFVPYANAATMFRRTNVLGG